MIKNIRICLLVDHAIDPRLRKRLKKLEEISGEIVVYEDSNKGSWLASKDWETQSEFRRYSEFGEDKEFDLLYVSGGKVFLDKFIAIYRMKTNTVIISEIPDLPLRFKSHILNVMLGFIFSKVVQTLSDLIVITSDGFKQVFKNCSKILLLENISEPSILARIRNEAKVANAQTTDKPIVIGFVGAIRYLPQLMMLLKYLKSARTRESIEVHFYGGPEDKLLNLIEHEEGLSELLGKGIFFHGEFNYEKAIQKIYANIDIVYAVYDASQLNVRLALPNKLYESMASRKPIIVASDTFLAEKINEYDLGWAVTSSSLMQSLFNEQMTNVLRDYKTRSLGKDCWEQLNALQNQEVALFSEIRRLISVNQN